MVRIRGRGRRKSFKREFKSTIRYALIVAIGFIVAYAWREAIFNSAEKLIAQISPTIGFISTELATALLLTLFGLILIFLIARFMKT